MNKPFLDALAGRPTSHVPIWLMRQAGRYLPEYRALRTRARSFLEFCYTPDLAVEATLQPLRRFPLDASIVFSDILVVPDALGQDVGFVEGEGPRLQPLEGPQALAQLSPSRLQAHLAPVYRTLSEVRAALPPQAALIGFAGAPFTLATYMIEGRGGSEFHRVKRWAYSDPASFRQLIDLLVEAVSEHLLLQIAAGAEAVQLFDSWAGILPDSQLQLWSVEPLQRIAARIRARYPTLPVIGFPRAVGSAILIYGGETSLSALSLDTGQCIAWARRNLAPSLALQGNLDPVMLLVGGEAMRQETARILDSVVDGRFVFNLGHGVLQQTPPDHVARLVDQVHAYAPGNADAAARGDRR